MLYLCDIVIANSGEIKVIKPDDFPGIHPNDLETTEYEGRDSLILEYSNPKDSPICQEIAQEITDSLGKYLRYSHGHYIVPTFPKMFQHHYFAKKFDIQAFKEQMAILKTIAR